MLRNQVALSLACVTLVAGCTSMSMKRGPASSEDAYVYMEDNKDARVRPWVDQKNAKVNGLLTSDARYTTLMSEVRKIKASNDRIPYPTIANGKIRNFWNDQKNIRGLWRQTTFEEYAKANPKWETILDIDELGKKEGKSWVFSGSNCMAPDYDLCLLALSDGGKDEVVIREFQVSTRSFVTNGFQVPPAKTDITWIDKDNVFIGSDFGPGSLTDSGYPRQVKLWKRGTPLSSAKLVYEGKTSDVSVSAWISKRPEGTTIYMHRGMSFFESETYLYDVNGRHAKLPFPVTASFQGNFQGFFFVFLREPWKVGEKTYAEGTLLSLPTSALGRSNALDSLEIVYAQDSKSAFSSITFSKHYAMLSLLNDVREEVVTVTRNGDQWKRSKLPFKNGSNFGVIAFDAHDDQDRMFFSNESFLEPSSLYYMNSPIATKSLKKVKSLPSFFDAKDLQYKQYFATSKDGTKVPYFVVHKKNMKLDGNNPTLLYGYGGFEISMTPNYLGTSGKVWSEKGGVYVLANIRGGGEFGPRWHRAALKENRQRAYDDFAAIAEDLFARKITSPRRLGIWGGSNGGLLVGVAFTQKPDYYNAVICEVPLLDMIRYTQIPPGASWIGEYGDPADAKMAEVISRYSPYQNVKSDVKYPQVLFYTSTADDRVHPGHARKMVARMEEQGHDVLLYENTEGGHGGASDLELSIKKSAIQYMYLYQKLMD